MRGDWRLVVWYERGSMLSMLNDMTRQETLSFRSFYATDRRPETSPDNDRRANYKRKGRARMQLLKIRRAWPLAAGDGGMASMRQTSNIRCADRANGMNREILRYGAEYVGAFALKLESSDGRRRKDRAVVATEPCECIT